MATDKPIRVAIIGLGFGAEFIPIYQAYPGAEVSAICRRSKKDLDECGDRWKIAKRYTDFAAGPGRPRDRRGPHQLADPGPRPAVDRRPGGRQARRLHRADGHDRSRSAAGSSTAQRKAGKVYMMMETVVYSREYLFVKELYDKGELGRIQFLRGSHQQDMAGWPGYWEGLPPMYYATHCVSPCLALAGQARRARRLPRLGADRRGADPQVQQPVRDRDGDLQDQGTPTSAPRSPGASSTPPASTARASTPTAARSRSSGSRSRARSRSSTPSACPSPRSPSGSRCPTSPTSCPSRSAGSRPRASTTPTTSSTSPSPRAAATAARTRTSSTPGSRAIKGDRPALPDAETSANWTMVGICAHESALKDGEKVVIPTF